MTIWLLALVLMASGAGLGYRQGAIRVAFSFVAIFIGAFLAGPLSRPAQALLVWFGLKTPPLAWLLAPIVVFYKYHAGDLRLVLWERLNRRVGLCLGIVNGAAYFILISALVYPLSYWTYQVASSESDPLTMRIINHLGQDIQSTGFSKVARALDPMPKIWYSAADLTGLVYLNPLVEARLARYPAFLSLAERNEFTALAKDTAFSELRQKKAPIMDIVHYGSIDAMIQNNDFLLTVWNTVTPDLDDLRVYLETGQSPKYGSEKILGRWNFDVSSAINLFRRLKPNITAKELNLVRRAISVAFEKTSFVAMTDGKSILKNCPPLHFPPTSVAVKNYEGLWKNLDGKYQLTMNFDGTEQDLPATVDGDRLTVSSEGVGLIFNRED